MDGSKILCGTKVNDLETALKKYHDWIIRGKEVYAMDSTHNCSKPMEYDVVKNNMHKVLKVILFNHYS